MGVNCLDQAGRDIDFVGAAPAAMLSLLWQRARDARPAAALAPACTCPGLSRASALPQGEGRLLLLWESTVLIRQVVTLILWERPRPRCFRSCGSALAMPGLQRHLHRLVLSPICRAQARSRREEGRLLLLWERAGARWGLPTYDRLHTCLAATSSAITLRSPCCQSGRTIPKSCCSLRLSSTDQAGRRAGVG